MPIPHSQRARLRRLVAAHVQALNTHDLDASMATFAEHASLLVNGQFSGTPRAIAAVHARLGFSPEPGLVAGAELSLGNAHFSDEQIIYEARLRGRHSGTAPGFPPATGAVLDLPCVLMFRFEPDDRLVAAHTSIDLGPLFRGLHPMPELPFPPTLAALGESAAEASGSAREQAGERARWRRHYDVHMAEEAQHDVEGVMTTFATNSEMIFNGMPFRDLASIAAGHLLFGWSAKTEGAFESGHSITDCLYYTDHELFIHGRFRGRHARDLLGFPGTGRDVELPYGAFYRFDAEGKLVSERIVMDWSPLVALC